MNTKPAEVLALTDTDVLIDGRPFPCAIGEEITVRRLADDGFSAVDLTVYASRVEVLGVPTNAALTLIREGEGLDAVAGADVEGLGSTAGRGRLADVVAEGVAALPPVEVDVHPALLAARGGARVLLLARTIPEAVELLEVLVRQEPGGTYLRSNGAERLNTLGGGTITVGSPLSSLRGRAADLVVVSDLLLLADHPNLALDVDRILGSSPQGCVMKFGPREPQ